MPRLKPLYLIYILTAALVLFYLGMKAVYEANEPYTYFHAARQLMHYQNIYFNNPFNQYLYSPLFALLMVPFSIIPWSAGRVLWMVVNVLITARLWIILNRLPDGVPALSGRYRKWWAAMVIILSLGFLNHNFILGQVTILILWLTVEGLWQIRNGRILIGSALIALGINIKIMPVVALVFLVYQKKFRAAAFTIVFFILTLFLPGLIVGFGFNNRLLSDWKNVINPAGEKFMFENDDSHSLNALLPAFLYDFGEVDGGRRYGINRKVAYIPHGILVGMLQGFRVLLLASMYWFARFRGNNREKGPVYFFWETGYLLLVTLLVLPHQMNYSMICFVPAGAYIIYFYLFLLDRKTPPGTGLKITGIMAFFLMLLLSVMGRDIIGDHAVNLLDFFHFMGFVNIIFLIIFGLCNPLILEKNAKLDRIESTRA